MVFSTESSSSTWNAVWFIAESAIEEGDGVNGINVNVSITDGGCDATWCVEAIEEGGNDWIGEEYGVLGSTDTTSSSLLLLNSCLCTVVLEDVRVRVNERTIAIIIMAIATKATMFVALAIILRSGKRKK
jgi:hypothetical protein